MRRCTLMLLLALFCFGANVFSQETTSEIQGTVTDESGAPLSGATIIALHTPSGTRYATSSRKDGRFNLPNLRIGGPYTITVTYVGFKKSEQENISLLLGQEFKADVHLVSDSKELKEIIVAASRQNKTFNTSHIGSQEIINRNQIERLPTINRSLQDFTKLEPTANGLNIGGRTSQYNNMTVDGANFNNSFGHSSELGGQTSSQPISIDAIEQIQVNLSPYDVTQGGFAGTGINSVTRSGTNQFKGSVYTFLKGAGTQGYDVGNVVVAKTPITYNLRGFSVGGPIIENKLFFFVSGEQVRQELPATSFTASDANHPALSGSVSKANKDSLESLIALLKQGTPKQAGYDPGAYQGYQFKTKSDKLTLKLDWNINRNNTLTFKYNYLKSYADQFPSGSRPNNGSSLSTSGSGSSNNNAMPFYSAGYGINNNFNIFIAELNTRFGNSASNKLQIGYTALRDFRTAHSPNDTMPFVDILDGSNNIFTSFGYEMYTYNNTLNTDVYQLTDIFKLYKGAHELTFGTQDYYRKYQNAFAPAYRGVYQFKSLNDFRNSYLYGTPNASNYVLQYSALPDGAFPWAKAGSTELGFFAQDKWRVLNNLTVTYGVRADMTIYKQSFTDNPNFDNLDFNGKKYNIGKAPGNALIISPRIGFNWDVFSNKTLQVRGGTGVFSGPPPFVWISNQASNNGIQFGALQTSNVAFGYKPTTGGANTSYSTALVADNFKYPTVLKANLAIDKKLPGDWTITLEGSYFKDLNAVYYSNLNLRQDSGYQLGGVDNRLRYIKASGSTYDVYRSNKYYYNKPTNTSFANNTVEDPSIGTAILMSNSHKGYGYNLTARVEKAFKNLFVSVAYTYSQSKNVAEGGSTASSLWSARAVGNANPNSDNLAYASFYQPHRVIAFASYRFEYAKHFATSVGAIFEATTAGASSYIYNGDVNGDGNTNDLIYIPRNASEINLVPVSGTTDTRTAAQIWTQLDNYIKQDNYLNSHRGEYAKANAWVFPWYKKLDLNITQDIYFYSKGKTETNKHTLRLTLDLINAGNFLNKYWGLVKTPNLSSNSSGYQLLKYEGLAADNKTPTYSFPYQDATNQSPYTNSFTNSTGIGSRWQMQFGIRYMFN